MLELVFCMNDAVVQFGQLTLVPAVGSTYQITGDALQAVDMGAAAFRTFLQMIVSILITAVHAAVAVVVYRTISDVVTVHHVHHAHDYFRIVGSIAVNLYIEDVSASGQVVIRSFHFGLVSCAALVIYRHMIGVSVVIAVCNARQHTELLAVYLGEASGQSLCRCSQYTVVMLISL